MIETEKSDLSVEIKRENVDVEGNVLEFYPESVAIGTTEPVASVSTNPTVAPPKTKVYEGVRVQKEPGTTSNAHFGRPNVSTFNDSFHSFICAEVSNLVQCCMCQLNYPSSVTRPVIVESDYEKKYFCGNCVKAFSEFLSMTDGCLVYSNHHLCDFCQRVFRKKKYLQEHITHMHMISDLVKCFKCKSKLSSSDAQLITDASDNETKHLCKKCIDKFRSCLSVRDATLVFLKGYFCDICDNFYANETAKKHKASAHPWSSKKNELTCNVCNQAYSTRSVLKMHLKVHDKKRMNFSCVRCVAAFPTERQRFNHSMQSHGSVSPALPHSQRELTSSSTGCLNTHLQATRQPPQSSEDVTFACTLCERVFSSRRFLDVHTKTAHTKRVARATEKKIAGVEHTAKAKLRCWVCNKIFPGLDALKTHMRKMHRNPTVT